MLISKKWNSHIKALVSGATVNILAKITAAGLGFISSMIITRTYGSDTMGSIATIISVVSIGTIIALCGFGTLTLKVISTTFEKSGAATTKKLFKKLISIVTLNAFLVATILTAFLFYTPLGEKLGLSSSLLLPGFLIFTATITMVSRNTLRGLGDYIKYSALELSASIFILLILTICVLFELSAQTSTHLYFLAYIAASILALSMAVSHFRKNAESIKNFNDITHSTLPSNLRLYQQALPMFGVAASQVLIQNTDILTIGYFRNQSDVGIYSIYVRLATFTAFASSAINVMFAPKVAVLYENKETASLKSFVKQTTLIASLLIIFLCAVLLVSHKYILNIYGQEFLEHLPTLYILLASTIVHTCFGAVGFFLNMTGKQKIFFYIMIFSSSLNLLMNVLFVPAYGMIGAATSTLITTLIWNTMATVVIYTQHKYTLLPVRILR